jgi:plasmid stability protein
MTTKKDGRGGRRPGAGRPRTISAVGATTTDLPQDLLDALRARAAVEGCSTADLTRRALRLYLRSSEAIDRYAAELVASSPELQALDRRWAAEDAIQLRGKVSEVSAPANPLDRAAGTRTLPED